MNSVTAIALFSTVVSVLTFVSTQVGISKSAKTIDVESLKERIKYLEEQLEACSAERLRLMWALFDKK